MTPKEQAEELVKKFDECLNHIACGSNGIEDHLNDRAKQCALIAVEFILSAMPDIVPAEGYGSARFINPDIEKWQAVKSEIEEL